MALTPSLRAALARSPLALGGARSCAEFDTDVALMRQAIPPALWAELRERGLIAADAPLPASS